MRRVERVERMERIMERIYFHTEILKWSRRTLIFRVCFEDGEAGEAGEAGEGVFQVYP
jgi:hypothetical protein